MAYKYTYDEEKTEYKKPKLQTNRRMWKFMLFSLLTLGIYTIIFFIPFSFDVDKVAPRRDGERTMNYLFAFILSLFTFNIVLMIWHYQMARRIETALEERSVTYDFSTTDFWIWYFVGSFLPFLQLVYFHKLCRAMNLLCENYNQETEAA